ncbi:MAG: glycosyltransferase [Polyangiaceae bacterium]|nr:glycosyltransferase [Polyangiaceae bacterium]
MPRRRVLMLTTDTGFGGAERSFSNVCAALSRQHQVEACIFSSWEPGHFPIPVPLRELRIPRGQTPLDRMARLAERIRRVRALKRSFRADVCISFLEGADYVNVLSRSTERVILSIRGSKRFDEFIQGGLNELRHQILLPLVLRSADAIVALSHGVRSELLSHYRLPPSFPVRVIHNFFDIDRIRSLSLEPLDPPLEAFFHQREVLVSHGRLSREKGLHHLIELLPSLQRQRPRAALLLAGDGPARHDLLALAASRGLRARWLPDAPLDAPADVDVLLVGHQENPYRYLPRSRLFLLASSAEGFGNSILEAMIAGTPVVSVDCLYGPREILAPGTSRPPRLSGPEEAAHGFLMPTFQQAESEEISRAWAQKLGALLGAPEERAAMAERGRQRAQDFREEAIARRWCELVDEAATQPRRG